MASGVKMTVLYTESSRTEIVFCYEVNEYDVIEWLAVYFSAGGDSWQVRESMKEALDIVTENFSIRLQIVLEY